MRSVMKHRFSEVPSVDIPRSLFDRSHGYKTTFDAGYLVPILVDEILPGDTVDCRLNGFARLATPVYPIMDNMMMDTFFFFVPNRLVWSHWEEHQGQRDNPGDSIDYVIPTFKLNDAANETIFDYFGLPTQVDRDIDVNALPFRAYNRIWDDWFRDENLQDSVSEPKGDGPDAASYFNLLRRGKRHDYFTSCLPWLQKGDAVQLSLGEYAPVTGIGKSNQNYTTAGQSVYETDGSASTTYAYSANIYGDQADRTWFGEADPNNAGYPNIKADLSAATASTVNELRQAIQTQRILEKDARAGTRYTEILQSHFGVTSPDHRLQRPEYLGGGSTPVMVSAVPRTDSSPGQLGAMGVASLKGHGFKQSFVEHGYIIGLVCVRADLTYQEGLDRMWTRSTRFDFYMPSLAHLGEQAVLNKEIYCSTATVTSQAYNDVFGYQERWAEYRYKQSRITGKFRSNDAASLDAWHLGIEFGAQPTLDDTFIQENPPVDRVIAAPTEPHFIWDSYIQYLHTRPMPTYSVPGLIDHF